MKNLILFPMGIALGMMIAYQMMVLQSVSGSILWIAISAIAGFRIYMVQKTGADPLGYSKKS